MPAFMMFEIEKRSDRVCKTFETISDDSSSRYGNKNIKNNIKSVEAERKRKNIVPEKRMSGKSFQPSACLHSLNDVRVWIIFENSIIVFSYFFYNFQSKQ